MKKICVIGSGNGAFAMAGYLTILGHEVTMWDDLHFKKNFEDLSENDNVIKVTGKSVVGQAKIHRLTFDMKEALQNKDLTLVIVPSFALETVAKQMVDHVKPGMKIYLCSGSTGGILELSKIFKDHNVLSGLRLGEFCTIPFGCRKTSPTTVNINTPLKFNLFAGFPACLTEELFDEVKQLFPNTTKAKDALECSLNNGNIICHGIVMLLNAAGTEGNPNNYHYRDGITPSIAKVMDKLDAERLAICEKMGYKLISTNEAMVLKSYCPELKDSTYEVYHSSEDFMTSPGPTSLNHRYLTEDIPFSALVVSQLGKLMKIPTPLFDAMITLSGALMETDYHTTGRTLEVMGIDGINIEELKDLLRHSN